MHFLPLTAQVLLAACLLLALPVLGANKTAASRALQPITLTIPGESRPVALYGESHALVIGAADYQNGWPKLSGVREDVDAVTQALEKQGFKITRVLNPTGDRLYKSIKRFIGQYGQKPDSRLLIYFAGHGHTLKPDADRQLGYLVPVDAPLAERDPGGFIEAALSMETMEGYAKQIRAKHALFVFDACFSGSFFKMRATPEVIALKTTLPVRQFITSGGADQLVPDVSVFRREFVAALDGEADFNGDGYILGSELGAYLEEKVTNYSRQTQTPQYGKIQDRNLDKGDFVFVLNRPDPEPDPRPEIPTRMEPAAPRTSGLTLDAIRQQQEVRDGWATWQARMRTDYQLVKAMNVAPELKATAWEQFLTTYPETNPYSGEAETLREQAQTRLAETQRQVLAQRLANEARPASSKAHQSYEPEMVPIPGKDYEMGKHEVTQAQWRAVMGNKPSIFQGCDNCPVEQVSWYDIQDYLKKLNAWTGKRYRLPTEAEWKHACDGGRSQEYCGGNDLDALGWYYGNSGGKTHPVGQKQANDYDLYDMSGNVSEWQQDCYDGECSERVLRGGSWHFISGLAHAAVRDGSTPSTRDFSLGFRVVRSARTD